MNNLSVSESCQCCAKYIGYKKDNYYYLSNNYHFDFVCKTCFDDINSKLVIQVEVDASKLHIIKQKAIRLYRQRKSFT